jgi:hypothetical protein
MRALWFVSLFPASLMPASALASGYHLEVVRQITTGAAQERGIHRIAACPDGTAVITHSGGAVTVIGREGAIRFSSPKLEPFTQVTASTCDSSNRLWVGGGGSVRQFEFSPSSEPRLLQTLNVPGGVNRLLIAGDRMYVLGLMRMGADYVILRQFSLSSGALIGAIPVDLPVWSGKTVNQLVLNGSLFLSGQGLVYTPANPFQFWRFDDGKQLEVKHPLIDGFTNADLDALRAGPAPPPRSLDWAFNAVPLPDGRVVVQFIKGNEWEKPAGSTQAVNFLAVFDSKLNLVASGIPVDEIGPGALLIGADSSGILYLSNLSPFLSSSLVQVRLAAQ